MKWILPVCAVLAGCGGATTTSSGGPPADPAATAFTEGTAAASADNSVSPATAAALAQIDGKEAMAALAEQGCLLVAADQQSVACVEHSLDMGFVTSRWHFVDLGQGAVTASYGVYDGPSDGNGVKASEVARVNERLKLGAFVKVGKVVRDSDELAGLLVGSGSKRMLHWQDKQRPVTLPPVTRDGSTPEGKQARTCCHWRLAAATPAKQSLALLLAIECDYTGDAAKSADACYIVDYNDESMPHDTELMVVNVK